MIQFSNSTRLLKAVDSGNGCNVRQRVRATYAIAKLK
jgi:hypothetical protein